MKAPGLYTVNDMFNMCDTQAHINGKWVPARPIGVAGIVSRLKLAWGVLTGKYDAVK